MSSAIAKFNKAKGLGLVIELLPQHVKGQKAGPRRVAGGGSPHTPRACRARIRDNARHATQYVTGPLSGTRGLLWYNLPVVQQKGPPASYPRYSNCGG